MKDTLHANSRKKATEKPRYPTDQPQPNKKDVLKLKWQIVPAWLLTLIASGIYCKTHFYEGATFSGSLQIYSEKKN